MPTKASVSIKRGKYQKIRVGNVHHLLTHQEKVLAEVFVGPCSHQTVSASAHLHTSHLS